jgi:S-adenosylmethionine decarboxylase proenzyme
MQGTHLLGEWYGCPADTPEFTRADALRKLCLALVAESGLTAVGDVFHQFEPGGVTGTVVLAESHLAIHTWPEFGSLTVDVYVCNFTADNTAKAERLFAALKAAFNPQRALFKQIDRGGKELAPQKRAA